MRRHLLTTGLALAGIAAAGTGVCLADADINFPKKRDVVKHVERLVGGEIEYSMTREREEAINEIDSILQRDKKGLALRTPAFWVETMQNGYFEEREQEKSGRLKEEKVGFFYVDESAGETSVAYYGGKLITGSKPAVLLVSLLPKGTDAKEWLEANWKDNDAVSNWAVAAVSMSDKFPVAEQPHLLAYVFGTMRSLFNCDGNRWYLEGVGEAASAAQRVATESLADRLAGLVLHDPTEALVNENAKLFHTVVVHSGDSNPVAAKLTEMSEDSVTAVPAGETAQATVATWITEHEGRTLPASYSFVTTTGDRIMAPIAGAVYLSTPAKRGEPITMTVSFDKEANTVTLDGENLGEFRIFMNDDLLDLDKPVKIVCNGEVLEEGRTFERDLKEIFDIADQFGEYGRVFTASYLGHAPTEIAEEGGEKKDGE